MNASPDAAFVSTESASSLEAQKLEAFTRWLQDKGVDLAGCTIRQSKDEGFGCGVFAPVSTNQETAYNPNDTTEGVFLVSPLMSAITSMSVVHDATLGSLYTRLLRDDVLDERGIVMLFLLVERARGDDSQWAPYFAVLPKTFSTSLHFSDDELQELRGTTLYNATIAKRKALEKQYEECFRDVAHHVFASADLAHVPITFEDFLWVNSVFWSRALNIPFPPALISVPQRDQDATDVVHSQEERVPTGEGGGGGAAEVGNSVPPPLEEAEGSESGVAIWLEGLMPGIDFCNHSSGAMVRWDVDDHRGSVSGVPNSMFLVTGPGVRLGAETEIYINYGNKSNEELLFLYGFVAPDNPLDALMIHFPMGALCEDECFEAKSGLLEAQGSGLQWFLPASLVSNRALPGGVSGELPGGIADRPAPAGDPDEPPAEGANDVAGWSGGRDEHGGEQVEGVEVPEDILAALRVISASEEDVVQITSRLQEIGERREEEKEEGGSKEKVKEVVRKVCGDDPALQLLWELIKERLEEMERGTGPEELDEALLARHDAATSSTARDEGQVDSSTTEELTFDVLTPNRKACVIHRHSQKKIAHSLLSAIAHKPR